MPTRALLLAALVFAGLVLAACGGDDETASGDGPSVVATTTQLADLARNVAGDRAQVQQMLPANADPHDYEPRPSDATALTGADLVLQSGGDLDEWLGEVLENAGADAERVEILSEVRTIEGDEDDEHGDEGGERGDEEDERGAGEEEHADAEAEHGDEEEHAGEEAVDPHWWHDPRNARTAVERIRDALSELDPGGSETYAANADAYLERLQTLDAAVEDCMTAIPAEQRKLVTDHDAMGYFADRYEIEVVGTVIPALSTQAQPSAGAVAELVRTIEREEVRAIFPGSSVNADVEEAIARESGAQVGAPLYADTLGAEGTAGETYLGALRANAIALAEGFTGGAQGCELPSG
jgi:ABC-type Zn uptake system ZnuABC Zn-binding protein ZnuA